MVEHDHMFKPEHADKLVSEKRQEMLPVDLIMEKMALEKHDVVADIGAGNGYFTVPIAKYTGETVYAVDAEPRMLDLLKNYADRERAATIQLMTAGMDDTPIGDGSVDKVLISEVIHHAPSLEKALAEIKRILKPDGSLFIIEFHKIDSSDGPPMEMRISPDEMTQALEDVGFSATIIELNDSEYAVKASLVK